MKYGHKGYGGKAFKRLQRSSAHPRGNGVLPYDRKSDRKESQLCDQDLKLNGHTTSTPSVRQGRAVGDMQMITLHYHDKNTYTRNNALYAFLGQFLYIFVANYCT